MGVATISESGTIERVFPADDHHAELAEKALASPGSTIEVTDGADGRPLWMYGAMVALPGAAPGHPVNALLLIRRVPYRMAWLKAVLLVSAGVSAMAALRFYTLNKWFRRKVLQPLREFGRLDADPCTALSQLPALEAGGWQETAQIASRLESLLRLLNDSDTRVRRLEQESRRQILHKEVGFDLKLKRAKDEATIDSLTKLRNRAFLDSDLEPLFQKQQEKKSRLSAVMMDVDNFKRYNDTHGHQAGDALLRFVGSLLRGGIRPIDYAVRYGGDEFLLLLPDSSAADAGIVADRLIKLFAQYAGQLSRDCGVSMSAGVACYPDDAVADGPSLVKAADAALYAAKHGGKNTVSMAADQRPAKSLSPPRPADAAARR
jgi:diguanylate cyclase (GGDEF)-like protein